MAGRDSPGLTASDNREFALVVGGAFLALAGLGWWQDHAWLVISAASLGGLLLLAGLLIPQHLGAVNRAWMALAESISRVTTPIVMGVLYLIVITPTGVLRRHLGENPIERDPDMHSFWLERDCPRSDLERQF